MSKLEALLMARHKKPKTRILYALWDNLGDMAVDLKLDPTAILRCIERDMPPPKEHDDRVVAQARLRMARLDLHDIRRMRVQAQMQDEATVKKHTIHR